MPRPMIAFILAGGRGNRLYPLTKERAKPALPFGGKFRIIDFALSNLVNSGIYSIYVLTQYKSQSLLRHMRDGWQFGGLLKNQFIIPVPAQMRTAEETWYQGTADAIYQNIDFIEETDEHLPNGGISRGKACRGDGCGLPGRSSFINGIRCDRGHTGRNYRWVSRKGT
jgi:glucose-1-phosphate adenylyltransferase